MGLLIITMEENGISNVYIDKLMKKSVVDHLMEHFLLITFPFLTMMYFL